MSSLKLRPNPGSNKSSKRIGRGNGSGHGTSSTRGCKGQKARSGGFIPARFEGGQTPLVRRLPKFRGFNNPTKKIYEIVNLDQLDVFKDGDNVTSETLHEKGLIAHKDAMVKVLGNGEIGKKLTFKIHRVSESARVKIEKAGGTITQARELKESKGAKAKV